ncbi:MAG TPA: efflux RND transporter periplasmic adaptor subunit [Macromonas sp.]|nr:efflux RND transporter periplasmic adaptor subunit [Macromonas sp.]
MNQPACLLFRTVPRLAVRGGVLLSLWGAGALHAAPFECLMQPAQIVEIRSAVEGVIQRIHVQRGDDVRSGQTLVELDAAVERSTAAAAKYRSQAEGRVQATHNRWQYAVGKARRSDDLHSQSFISAQARDEADTEKRLAESEMKEALENQELARLDYQRSVELLNQKTLRSPFKGIVMDRMLNPGDLAESGNGRKPILKLAQIDPLHVEVVLPWNTFGKLRPGMTGLVRPEGGEPHKAAIKIVDRVVDAASGTYGVRLELPNPKGQLPGGVRCQVEFADLNGVAVVGQKPR